MAPSVSSHPTWIELDLEAVAGNCARVIQDTATPLMAVVKGDAYGHGAVAVGRAAVRGGASWLGVARCGEARALRQAGLDTPILVLGMATGEEVDEAIASASPSPCTAAPAWSGSPARARAAGRPLAVHLKVDTGLGRLGVPVEDLVPFARQAAQAPGIQVDGVFSHLALAEEPDHPHNRVQTDRFQRGLAALEQAALRPRWAHLANSAAALFLPDPP